MIILVSYSNAALVTAVPRGTTEGISDACRRPFPHLPLSLSREPTERSPRRYAGSSRLRVVPVRPCKRSITDTRSRRIPDLVARTGLQLGSGQLGGHGHRKTGIFACLCCSAQPWTISWHSGPWKLLRGPRRHVAVPENLGKNAFLTHTLRQRLSHRTNHHIFSNLRSQNPHRAQTARPQQLT